MPQEGVDTPKLALLVSDSPSQADMRCVKQLGVNFVDVSDAPSLPWTEKMIRVLKETLARAGLTLGVMMIPWATEDGRPLQSFLKIVFGKNGRDQEIEKVQESLRAAGSAGLPVVEYDFFSHRIVEGYYAHLGRGGAGSNAFDYERVKDLPPLPKEGVHTYDEIWANLTYFLKAVVPVAEASNVRLALHPNDPPPPISRKSTQIMNSLADWKKLIEIVPSKSNGITFDCGVTRELGEDPVEVCRYFGSRDRINHMHFRNVRTQVPREKYLEVFPDEGDIDMLAVMRELVRQHYSRLIVPEHPLILDADRHQTNYPDYTGWTYNVAYARAMLQAALENR
jgi:mannonate dehydratase